MSANNYTPLSHNRKFGKLSLKRQYIKSCPFKQTIGKYHPSDRDVEDAQSDVNHHQYEKETRESLPLFYENKDFNTPPFVTTSRPRYTKKCSSPNSSEDFISNTPDFVYDSIKIDKHEENLQLQDNFSKMFDSFPNSNVASPISDEVILLNDSINARLSGTSPTSKDHSITSNFKVKTPHNKCLMYLSPKSEKIMTSLYGDVWKKTPGLFKKKKSIDKKIFDTDECNSLTDQLNSLNLEKKYLYEGGVDSPQSKKEEIGILNASDNVLLKPRMLTFEIEDENKSFCFEIDKNNPESDKSDNSLFSVKKKVRKKQIFSSSSSNDNSDGEISKPITYALITDSDNEEEECDENVKIVKRKSIFRIESNMDCSVILIETDTQGYQDTVSKINDKRTRKLFSKHNKIFDEVEFVAEYPPDVKNRIYKIFDNDIFEKEPSDTTSLNCNVETTSAIETIFKPKKDVKEKDVKKVKRKKIEKKTSKENIPPAIGLQSNVDLNNLQVYGFMASLSDTIPSWRCNKEAKYFKDNFKSKKAELTKKLFIMFNDKVYSNQLEKDLPITWSTTLQTTAGRAYNKIKRTKTSSENIKSSSVELSLKVVDTVQRLRDTLAHELCHVAAWMIDGQLKDGHGPYWKKWVTKTLKEFPELGSIPVCHSLTIHYKYTFKCTRCGYSINRQSKSIDVSRKACGYCGGRFECIRNKKNKDGLIVSTPVKRPSRELKGFALYVKENYGNVRGSNTPHKQAMQYLGKQYAKLKVAQSSDTDQ